MIDISTITLYTLVAGSSVAVLTLLQPKVHSKDAPNAQDEIKRTIELFVKAGDTRNTSELEILLHEHFRVVANQLLGSTTISVISKNQYLALMLEGKLGGDTRTLDIQSIEIIGKNASVKVLIVGKALTFESFYHLVQNNGHWQIIQDLPFATKN